MTNKFTQKDVEIINKISNSNKFFSCCGSLAILILVYSLLTFLVAIILNDSKNLAFLLYMSGLLILFFSCSKLNNNLSKLENFYYENIKLFKLKIEKAIINEDESKLEFLDLYDKLNKKELFLINEMKLFSLFRKLQDLETKENLYNIEKEIKAKSNNNSDELISI